jgi:hypothetical protein
VLVKEKNDDGVSELVGVTVTRKSKSKKGKRGTAVVDAGKVRDQFIGALSKRSEEWLTALLKMDAAKLRQAVLAAKRAA